MRILAKENAETFASPPVSALGVSIFGVSGTAVFLAAELLLTFSSVFEVSV
ncbi:hypothetical protein NLG42_20780 [Flavobacterium plurextorum]|uniref:hypothetical protein n=1 Tax=Flavobacterium TaxID=237 RepID=UPI00214DAE8A|nr:MULTISPECIES: hypothetical protein [Flavobacterium]UUW08526.1 hypothetical protein NLG42_20780 [Flavobacterium plurextorum]